MWTLIRGRVLTIRSIESLQCHCITRIQPNSYKRRTRFESGPKCLYGYLSCQLRNQVFCSNANANPSSSTDRGIDPLIFSGFISGLTEMASELNSFLCVIRAHFPLLTIPVWLFPHLFLGVKNKKTCTWRKPGRTGRTSCGLVYILCVTS